MNSKNNKRSQKSLDYTKLILKKHSRIILFLFISVMIINILSLLSYLLNPLTQNSNEPLLAFLYLLSFLLSSILIPLKKENFVNSQEKLERLATNFDGTTSGLTGSFLYLIMYDLLFSPMIALLCAFLMIILIYVFHIHGILYYIISSLGDNVYFFLILPLLNLIVGSYYIHLIKDRRATIQKIFLLHSLNFMFFLFMLFYNLQPQNELIEFIKKFFQHPQHSLVFLNIIVLCYLIFIVDYFRTLILSYFFFCYFHYLKNEKGKFEKINDFVHKMIQKILNNNLIGFNNTINLKTLTSVLMRFNTFENKYILKNTLSEERRVSISIARNQLKLVSIYEAEYKREIEAFTRMLALCSILLNPVFFFIEKEYLVGPLKNEFHLIFHLSLNANSSKLHFIIYIFAILLLIIFIWISMNITKNKYSQLQSLVNCADQIFDSILKFGKRTPVQKNSDPLKVSTGIFYDKNNMRHFENRMRTDREGR